MKYEDKLLAGTWLGVLIFLLLITFLEIWSSHDEIHRLKRDLSYYQTNYLRQQGGTALWSGSTNGVTMFDLRSFDGGKLWYSTHTGTNGELVIDGQAEKVQPGLVKTLQDWDNIEKYAETNGPIDLSNPEQVKVLSENGFTVTRKAN